MLPAVKPPPTRFYTDEPDLLVVQKGIKNTNRIAATTDTGDYIIGQTVAYGQNLLSGFSADY